MVVKVGIRLIFTLKIEKILFRKLDANSIIRSFRKLSMKLLNRKQKSDKGMDCQSGKKYNKPGHVRIESFDAYFNDAMKRKNNQFVIIDSPHLNQQISDLSPSYADHYISSISTPQHRPYKHLERKKFIDIKERIVKSVLQFQKSGINTLQEVFNIKQLMLNEFLNDFTDQIQKECKQKGEILKYIWNSMFGMIQHITEQLGRVMQQMEREGLSKQLENHKTYQNLIDVFKKKQNHLNEKYILQKKTITKLVYELRFKRKQIARLYKNQKLLLNRLNEIKNDNLNIQNSYIDLMSTVRDLPTESVEQLLKAREQINKSRQKKFKILGNKKVNRIQIAKQLSKDSPEQLNELFDQIKDIAADDDNSPHIISTLIEAAIQNFGIKNDDNKVSEYKIVQVIDRKCAIDAQTQISECLFKNPNKRDQVTQFSYHEKLRDSYLENKITQTCIQVEKKKKFRDYEIQTQKQYFLQNYVEKHFKIRKVYEDRLWFAYYKQKEPVLNINHYNLNRTNKKHMSEANLYIGRNTADIYLPKNSEEQRVVAVQESPKQEVINIQNTLIQSRELQKKFLTNQKFKENKIKKKTKKSSIAYNVTNKKHDSIVTNQSKIQSKQIINQQFKKTDPSSNIKYSRFRDRTSEISRSSSQQIKIKQLRNSNQHANNGSYNKLRDQYSNLHFIEKSNLFNIQINEEKQKFISNFFVKRDNFCFDLDQLSSQDSDLEDQMARENNEIQQKFKFNNTIPVCQSKKNVERVSQTHLRQKRASMQIKCNDENDMLMSLCRNKYYKNIKKAKGRGSILKYKEEFTCVKDKIEMIVRDVQDLIIHKEGLLKKMLNHKNVKNTYKILMMTLAKAYDCYNKGIPITSLVHPLFQTFSLIYGAINSAQVYKKMINFIACLSISQENTILRFFLFLLGLDNKSPYSGKLTISQVYLCLTLLQKITVDGKVTLNIQSICTDVNKVKEQLVAILKEQKIPNQLIGNIKRRVDEELTNSTALREVDQNDAHLKINIYNIILLVIQEVIKCKNHIMQSFIPIFACFSEDYEDKRIPTVLLQCVLSMCKQDQISQYKFDRVIKNIKKSNKAQSMTYEQFCSILFDNNIISFNQMMKRYHYIKAKWRIPSMFYQEMKEKQKKGKLLENLQLFQINFVFRLQKKVTRQVEDAHTSIEKMKKLIFLKYYEKKIKSLTNELIGDNLVYLVQ